jgi:DNA-binding CsgD family transcriptional regulator
MPERGIGPDLPMSQREATILIMLTRGASAGEIAVALRVTPNYVYSLIRLLKARFGAKTNAGIVSRAIAEGVITPDGELIRPKR